MGHLLKSEALQLLKQRTHLQSSLLFDSTVRSSSMSLGCDTEAGQRGSISALKELPGRREDKERQNMRD